MRLTLSSLDLAYIYIPSEIGQLVGHYEFHLIDPTKSESSSVGWESRARYRHIAKISLFSFFSSHLISSPSSSHTLYLSFIFCGFYIYSRLTRARVVCLLFDGWWFFLSRSSPLNNVFVFPSTSASRRLTALFSWIEVFWMLFSTFFVCVFLALIHKQISSALELSALATNVAVHPRTHLTIMSDLLGLYIFLHLSVSGDFFVWNLNSFKRSALCAFIQKKLFFRFTRLPASAIRLSYRRLACEMRKTHTHFFLSCCVSLVGTISEKKNRISSTGRTSIGFEHTRSWKKREKKV